MNLTGKGIVVLGYGITGRAVVDFLSDRSIKVFVSEKSFLSPDDKEYLSSRGVLFEEGGHTESFCRQADFICPSPGIRLDKAIGFSMPVVSELDLASLFFKGRIIAITGTNGKSTTTSIINSLLNRASLKSKAVGNIGMPFISIAGEDYDFAVVEVSSFQLFYSSIFSPEIGVILNIAPDHLNWHKDMNEYVETKYKLISLMKSGLAVLNGNDEYLSKLSIPYGVEKVFFPLDNAEFDLNWQAAYLLSKYLKIPDNVFFEEMQNFEPLPHRLRFIGEKKGITFIDDSKATNVHSTIWALKNVKGHVRLLAGGSYKGDDFSQVLPYCKDVIKVYAYGEEGKRIEESLSGHLNCGLYENMKHALNWAWKEAEKGDTILLSPMCASFDEFKDYKERGDVFASIVKGLVG